MRLLVVSPFVPGPTAGHGAGVYLGALLGELAGRCDHLTLVANASPRELETARAVPDGYSRRLVATAADLADLHGSARLLRRVRNLARWSLSPHPLAVVKAWTPTLARVVSRALADDRPDACLVEHTLAAPAVAIARAAGCPVILTDHEAGAAIPTEFPLSAMARRDARRWQRHVSEHYRAADLLQTVTEQDADTLRARLPGDAPPVHVRPVVAPVPDRPIARPGSARPRALFFGDFRHRPNAEAFALLRDEVWPRVRATSADALLTVAGHGSDRLGHDAGIETLGFVEDLDALLADARLLLAPVPSGDGTRVKVVTALAAGLPVVTNARGGRGLESADPSYLQQHESADDLARATIALLDDAAAADAAGRDAHRWAREHVSAAAVADQQLQRIEEILRRTGR